jgi:hypothetical protein
MAIKINTNVQTAEGFEIQPFCYLLIQCYNPGFSNCILTYYKDQAAFEAGAQSLNIPSLPSAFNADITAEEFWGPQLALDYHNKAVAAIEAITGPESCSIVQ